MPKSHAQYQVLISRNLFLITRKIIYYKINFSFHVYLLSDYMNLFLFLEIPFSTNIFLKRRDRASYLVHKDRADANG